MTILRLWVMPLPSSFWLDETGTEFVVRHGASHPSFAVAPQVPASLYYWLPRMMDGLAQRPGWLETAYRLPSALALGLALFLIARIAARWIHPSAGWFAAFACLGLRGFNFEAADARPYAFGTLIAAAAVWALIRWLDRARWGDALLFAILAGLLWRVQLIFWPFYAVFAIYAAARLLRHETPVKWIHAAGIAIVIGAALVPVAAAAVKLFQHAGSHVIATEPGKSEVTRSLKFGIIAVGLLGGWVVSRFVRGAVQRPGASAWIGIAGWWLIPAAGLFGFSHLTGNSVYVDRYLSLLLPGAALAATAAASLYLPARAWPGAAVALGLGVLSFMGRWTEKWPTHGNSDWRAAAQSINDLGLGPNVPVLCPSAFIEAQPPDWSPGYALPGFLYAQLDTYPIQGKPLPFPFQSTLAGAPYAAELTGDLLVSQPAFAIYGTKSDVNRWRRWFAAQPRLAGFRTRDLGDFGDVGAVLFRKG